MHTKLAYQDLKYSNNRSIVLYNKYTIKMDCE